MIKVSKQFWIKPSLLILTAILFSSCGVIIGGSNYYAHVTVENHPEAVISFEGESQGSGTASFSAPRRKADSFSIKVKEPGCKEQVFDFTEKKYRGWTLAGSVVTGVGLIASVPVPFGLMVDGATGSLWKPSINEAGVSEIDFKNYHYNINYTGCGDNPITTTKENKSKAKRLTELEELLKKEILSQDEFETLKKKILSE